MVGRLIAWQILAVLLTIGGAIVATDDCPYRSWMDRFKCGRLFRFAICGLLVAGSQILFTVAWYYYGEEKAQAEVRIERQGQAAARDTERMDILRLVHSELISNHNVLKSPAYADTTDKQLEQPVWYPRMQSVALHNAITSKVFLGRNDREFLKRCFFLHRSYDQVNALLPTWQPGIVTAPMIVGVRRTVNNNTAELLKSTEELIALLTTQYRVDPKEDFFGKSTN